MIRSGLTHITEDTTLRRILHTCFCFEERGFIYFEEKSENLLLRSERYRSEDFYSDLSMKDVSSNKNIRLFKQRVSLHLIFILFSNSTVRASDFERRTMRKSSLY